MTQPSLFDIAQLPQGLQYEPEIVSSADHQHLVRQFEQLPFAPFAFHGFLGNRRVVSYGYRYDYGAGQVRESAPLPDFLLGLRDIAARFAKMPPARLVQALATEYASGAGIGWHKDKPQFGDVVALSFVSACVLRFRRKNGLRWDRRKLTVEPRSAYVLRGPARWEWEHSIVPQKAIRYSVTFRTVESLSA